MFRLLKLLRFLFCCLDTLCNSTAHWKVNSTSVRSCVWVVSQCNPQTKQSLRACLRWSLKSQFVVSSRNSATYLVLLSSGAWFLLCKLKCLVMTTFLAQSTSLILPSLHQISFPEALTVTLDFEVYFLQQCWGKLALSFHWQFRWLE